MSLRLWTFESSSRGEAFREARILERWEGPGSVLGLRAIVGDLVWRKARRKRIRTGFGLNEYGWRMGHS